MSVEKKKSNRFLGNLIPVTRTVYVYFVYIDSVQINSQKSYIHRRCRDNNHGRFIRKSSGAFGILFFIVVLRNIIVGGVVDCMRAYYNTRYVIKG